MSVLLLTKLTLSPLLIGLASLAGRRWGPNVAGMLGGLPIVAGPLVVVLWLTQGERYAAQVALSSPAGVWGNVAYMLGVGYASAYLRWPGAILAGWGAYLLVAFGVYGLGLAELRWVAVLVVAGLWLAATRLLPKPRAAPPVAALPRSELLVRILAAACLVFGLSTASPLLGPALTGVFAGAPVAATVIPAFTYANAGRDALLLALRGFLTGLMGFAVFFLVLAETIVPLGWWALLVSALAGGAVGWLATLWARRSA